MSDELGELAAIAALGTLGPDERDRLDREAAHDRGLAEDIAHYGAIVVALEAAVAREQQPARLLDGILARIEAEQPAARPVTAAFTAPERRAWWSWRPRRVIPAFAAGFAAAAAVIALAFVLVSNGGLGPTDAEAAVKGKAGFAAVHGTAKLHGAAREDGRLELELDDVPTPPRGEHYEVWVLRAEGHGAMEAVGAFVPHGHDVRLELRLPGPGNYQAVDVSVQPDGGSAEHSAQTLASGSFTSAHA